MAKVHLHPLFQQLRGKIHGITFRLSHNGQISAYGTPDMSDVKWSPAQKKQRERIAEATAYGKAAMADPELREYYLKMAWEKKMNKRPFDMAVKDYCQGNNLLGEKFHWDVEHWRAMKQYRKRKKR